MRILAIYNKESDHARATEDFLYEELAIKLRL